ncbi:YccF domain-containing protein [Roseofilum casamattae]|uniref:YccF domain-containing protein n=1 Tax=Roseofilum casamattae BLCC-M143 TaxID=3022442 RepID=A0ABT7BU99_9CYAN|nr:YccF domain-containing protein [Roseofilum casamattae]MDJ1182762.1 YccF domain-containing protein [Roseofilum casamattae BLCC-M143]
MTLFGNVIWLIFGGFLSGIGYIVGGISLCLTIVGIPFGWQAIKLGLATFTPFGKQTRVEESASGVIPMVFNLIWVVLFGWEIALSHLIHGLILFITIIGIPFAQQHFKLIPLALFPFGRQLEDI